MVKPINVFKIIHRWLGVILAPFMVMWFISGFFMIFSGFPRVQEQSRFSLLDNLTPEDSLSHLNQLGSWYAEAIETTGDLSRIEIEKNQGKLLLTLSGNKGEVIIDGSTKREVENIAPTLKSIEEMTYRITGQPIQKIDTLRNLNQWIPFDSRRADLPIIKVSTSDPLKTKLYFSGQTGKLLQQTNKNNRLLAYFGAIPHWLYFWQIRQNVDLWTNIFKVLGVLACTMIISGIVMGIYRASQSRRLKPKRWSPYKKRLHYWHHITGLIFGIVVLTWMFSGWMSLDTLPKWLTGPMPAKEYYALGKSSPFSESTTFDFDLILREKPTVKRITCANYLGQNYYLIEDGEQKEYITISNGQMQPLRITEEDVKTQLANNGIHEILEVKEITKYTSNYLPHPKSKRKPPLPAIKVKIQDGTSLYIAHEEPRIQVMNRATIMNSWAYQKLHSLKFLWAYHHPTIWMIVMFVLLAGGTAVSITGFTLGCKRIKQSFKRLKK